MKNSHIAILGLVLMTLGVIAVLQPSAELETEPRSPSKPGITSNPQLADEGNPSLLRQDFGAESRKETPAPETALAADTSSKKEDLSQQYLGLEIQLEINLRGLAIEGVDVYASQSLQGPWENLGRTNADGQLKASSQSMLSNLLFYKPGDILMLTRNPGGYSRSTASRVFIADGHEPWTLEVVSAQTGSPIANAEVSFGEVVLGQTDSSGLLSLIGKGDVWRIVGAEASGFLSQERVAPTNSSTQGQYLAKLHPVQEKPLQLVSAKFGNPISDARILLFPQQKTARKGPTWETTSDEKGEFFLPENPAAGSRLIAWHPSGLWASMSLGVAVEKVKLQMEETPALVFSTNNLGKDGNRIASCTATSFWRTPLPTILGEDGSVSIPGALGALNIEIVLHSGMSFVLRRTREFQYRDSFTHTGILAAATGKLLLQGRLEGSLRGSFQGTNEIVQEGDKLEITYSNLDLGMKNYESWPELGGARPSDLNAWQWEDQSIRSHILISEDGTFEFAGLPLGRGVLAVRNLSNGGIKVPLMKPCFIEVPSQELLSLQARETVPVDFIVLAQDGGEPPSQVQLECATGNDFDAAGLLQFKYYSNHVKEEIPGDQTQMVQVIAAGFYPARLPLEVGSDSLAIREIRLERLNPMRIIFEDQRSESSEATLAFSHGRYIEEEVLFSPFETLKVSLTGTTSFDFYGAFPDCDVWVRPTSINAGQVLQPHFYFEPGGEIRIVFVDL